MKKTNGEKPAGWSYSEPYNATACTECGECLMRCPVMRLDAHAAVREMRELRAGRPGRHVLRRCESCMACNMVCPWRANPAQLFLDTFHKHLSEHGTPAWAEYFQPHAEKNFRTFVVDRMPAAERDMLRRWADDSPCDEFTYPGCNMCVTPYITRASFLKDLNIRGGLHVCCGEMYFRTGQFERLAEQARALNAFVKKLGAKKMMILCTAGYNLFTNILPRHGFDADIEITSYLPWLYGLIENGDIKVKRPLDMAVTIQESCHAKVFGQEYWELPRRILERLGAQVKEMHETPECALCCGIGGGFPARSGYNPVDVARSTMRITHRAVSTGADAIVTYCSGCMQSLSAGMSVYPVKKPVYHLVQAVQAAAGERPALDTNRRRGALMFRGVMQNQTPLLLSNKRKGIKSI